MLKKDALKYIRSVKGYVPCVGIFDIYDDEDEIPQTLIDLCLRPEKCRSNFVFCGVELAEMIEKVNNINESKQSDGNL